MEKINQIEINNFKSIKHLKVDGFKKINVFIGMPNAGKSNLLEALGLFGGFNAYNRTIKDFVRFGNYNELFFEENVNDSLKIKIEKSELIFTRHKSLYNWNQNSESGLSLGNEVPFGYGFDNGNGLSESDAHNYIAKIYKYHFSNIAAKNVKSGLKTLNFPLGENLVEIIATNPIIRKEVIRLFNLSRLKLLIDKNSNEIKLFKEYQDGTFFTLSYELIADTLQRLIFYKVAIMSNENSVLLFEEPEAHCFEPYVQEFTNSVKYDKNDNQFFIVTHSDFIIQEFLRDEESRNNTSIYLVNNIDGETKVKQLLKENNEDVYELGMNPFFNFESLWDAN
ncbi:AAA family ATPase [Flavobacterium sp. DGU11]|uniref:AAA family ATPase n=1 Tax=Flavobacterium arundinis TaxID=3139143 RepID=A0ABU9I210_9FLAO